MQRAERIAGYTLIEVIVALVVFAVGALALAASSGLICSMCAGARTRYLGSVSRHRSGESSIGIVVTSSTAGLPSLHNY